MLTPVNTRVLPADDVWWGWIKIKMEFLWLHDKYEFESFDYQWVLIEKLLWSEVISLKTATQGIEEGGFLSPSLSIRNAMEHFRFNNLWISTLVFFQFRRTNGGKRWWWVHDVCDGRLMRRPWRQTTFDSGNIHACLVPCKWCKDPRGRNIHLRLQKSPQRCEASPMANHR